MLYDGKSDELSDYRLFGYFFDKKCSYVENTAYETKESDYSTPSHKP